MKESQNNQLISAIKQNNLDLVRELLANGADPNTKDKDEKTALMWAVNTHKIGIVNALLDAGAKPNAKDSLGNTPLIWAIDIDIVNALLDKGANPNAQDKDEKTALMLAIMWDGDNKDIIDRLLKAKVNPNTQDKYGKTALSQAIDKGDINIIDIFLNNGVTLNAALLAAVQRESLKITQVLLEALDQKKNTLNTTYKDASYQNQGVIAREILKINRNITQALLVAIEQENINLVNALLEKGADPNVENEYGNTALFVAVEKGSLEITRALLEKGADPYLHWKNRNGKSTTRSLSSYAKSPEIKSMLEEASSLHQKLDRKATKHIKSALKEVSKNKNSVGDIFADDVDDIFADDKYKLNKHISQKLFDTQAQQILEGMKLTFIEKVKSVFQGRDEVVSQKAMKQLKESLKDDVGYKELIAQKVEARHDKQQQRQYDMMKEFMPSSKVFMSAFLEYDGKGGMAKIVRGSEKDIIEMSKAVKDGITDYIKEKSNKSLTSAEQKTLESNLVKAYQQLAREIRRELPNDMRNIKHEDADIILQDVAKGSSFAKAMKDIEGGKKPELPKGSAAALFVEAIKPLTRSTFKDKVTAETSNKSHQKGR